MIYLSLYAFICMCLFSIIFFINSILGVLIVMEGFMLILFCFMIHNYKDESVLELLIFMVAMVSEAVLGLVILLMKINMSGEDMLVLENVI